MKPLKKTPTALIHSSSLEVMLGGQEPGYKKVRIIIERNESHRKEKQDDLESLAKAHPVTPDSISGSCQEVPIKDCKETSKSKAGLSQESGPPQPHRDRESEREPSKAHYSVSLPVQRAGRGLRTDHGKH